MLRSVQSSVSFAWLWEFDSQIVDISKRASEGRLRRPKVFAATHQPALPESTDTETESRTEVQPQRRLASGLVRRPGDTRQAYWRG